MGLGKSSGSEMRKSILENDSPWETRVQGWVTALRGVTDLSPWTEVEVLGATWAAATLPVSPYR